jgi:hypothetical protein
MKMLMTQNFLVVVLVVDVVLSIYMLNYLQNLLIKGCDCSVNNKRTIIMVGLLLSIVFNLLTIAFILISPNVIYTVMEKNMHFVAIISIATMFSSFLFAVLSLDYIYNLKDCKCSSSSAKQLLTIVSIVNVVIYSLTVVRFTGMSSLFFLYSRR